ncbi:MAG: metal-dependent hydrolase, partial [Planctomycetaceae bacterium]
MTQTALGASIGAVFRPKLGRGAILFGGLCGAIPDIDVLFDGGDAWVSLVTHRGWTHSLFWLTLAAPVFGFVASRIAGKREFWTWTHLAFWALVTHTLLDWCTPYGTQLLLPFTNARYAIDAVAVIDPFYTLPLLCAVFAGLLPWTSARWTRRLAASALILSTGYLVLGYAQSRYALSLAEPQLRQSGFEPVEARATPTFFNLFLRRIVARDAEGDIAVGMVSTLAPRPIEFVYFDTPDDPLVDRALASPRGRIMHWFAMRMISAEVERREDGTTVWLTDRRYGLITRPEASPFGARAEFDADGQLI